MFFEFTRGWFHIRLWIQLSVARQNKLVKEDAEKIKKPSPSTGKYNHLVDLREDDLPLAGTVVTPP